MPKSDFVLSNESQTVTHFVKSNKDVQLDETQEIPKEKLAEIVKVFNKYWGNTIGQMSIAMTHTQMMLLVQKAFYYQFDPKHYPDNCDIFHGTGLQKYNQFSYDFFNAWQRYGTGDNDHAYKGLETILFRMAFALKRIKIDIPIDEQEYDSDVAECLIQIQDELGTGKTPGWSNYEAEILFSLYEIKSNITGIDKNLIDIIKRINHFRSMEWTEKITVPADHNWYDGKAGQMYGLLPTSGYGKANLYTNTAFLREIFNGILERYFACQNIYPIHCAGGYMNLEIPTCSSDNIGYGDNLQNSYEYAYNVLCDALYLSNYSNAYSDSEKAYQQFRQDNNLKSTDIDETFLRKLFKMHKRPIGVHRLVNKTSQFEFHNHNAIQASYWLNNTFTYVEYTNQTKISQAKVEPLDIYETQNTDNTNGAKPKSLSLMRIIEPTTENIYSSFSVPNKNNLKINDPNYQLILPEDYSGHTQTLCPAYANNTNIWFIGCNGQHTTDSKIQWAQDFARIDLRQDASQLTNAPKIINADRLIDNATRIEANVTPDFKYFTVFINTSDQNLAIYIYKLAEINNWLDTHAALDLSSDDLEPINTRVIKNINQWTPSFQGFSVDNDLNIYISCQKAPNITDTNMININNWPRRVVKFNWNDSGQMFANIINLVSGTLVLPDKNKPNGATEVEGLQCLDKNHVQLLVMFHPASKKPNDLAALQDLEWV